MHARPLTVSRSGVDTAVRIGVVVLTLMAAMVHLSRLFPDPVFIPNALGYLALLAALLPSFPRLVPHRHLQKRSAKTEPLALPRPPGLPGFQLLPRGRAQCGGERNRGGRVPFVLPHQLAVALGLLAERAADAGAPPANAAEADVSHLPFRHPNEVRLTRRMVAVRVARDAVHAVAPVPLALLCEIGPLRFPGAPENVHRRLPSL